MFLAITEHQRVNHLYDGYNYCVHLQATYAVAVRYINLVISDYVEIVLASIWCHDIMEEPHLTYNDIVAYIGKQAADIVYAVTDEKGHNRAERHNDKYFDGINRTPYATFVKLCDRIANARYSLHTKSKMYKKYQDEQKELLDKLYNPDYKEMFDELTFTLNCDPNGVPYADYKNIES